MALITSLTSDPRSLAPCVRHDWRASAAKNRTSGQLEAHRRECNTSSIRISSSSLRPRLSQMALSRSRTFLKTRTRSKYPQRPAVKSCRAGRRSCGPQARPLFCGEASRRPKVPIPGDRLQGDQLLRREQLQETLGPRPSSQLGTKPSREKSRTPSATLSLTTPA